MFYTYKVSGGELSGIIVNRFAVELEIKNDSWGSCEVVLSGCEEVLNSGCKTLVLCNTYGSCEFSSL